MNTIQSEWERFKKATILESAEDRQIEEMRQFFYCGAIALLNIQERTGQSSPKAREAIFEGIIGEIREFRDELKREEESST